MPEEPLLSNDVPMAADRRRSRLGLVSRTWKHTAERFARYWLPRAEHPEVSPHLVTLMPEFAVDVPEEIEVHSAWQWLVTAPGKDCE